MPGEPGHDELMDDGDERRPRKVFRSKIAGCFTSVQPGLDAQSLAGWVPVLELGVVGLIAQAARAERPVNIYLVHVGLDWLEGIWAFFDFAGTAVQN